MVTRKKINSKEKKRRFFYLIIVPIFLSLMIFNMLIPYKFQPESDTSTSVDGYRISDIHMEGVHNYFLINYVKRFCGINDEEIIYNIKIKDLSEVTPEDKVVLNSKINFNGQIYAIPYQQEVDIASIAFKDVDKIVSVNYTLERITDDNSKINGTFTPRFKIMFSIPFSEVLYYTFIIFIAWLAVCRLIRKTRNYIFFDTD